MARPRPELRFNPSPNGKPGLYHPARWRGPRKARFCAAMIGMDANTGKAITGAELRAMRIARILTTPLGSCVMRRDFGSLLFELLDRPLNVATAMLLRAATAIAIRRWQNGFQITRVTLSGDFPGGAPVIGIEGYDLDAPDPTALVSLSIPIRRNTAALSA